MTATSLADMTGVHQCTNSPLPSGKPVRLPLDLVGGNTATYRHSLTCSIRISSCTNLHSAFRYALTVQAKVVSEFALRGTANAEDGAGGFRPSLTELRRNQPLPLILIRKVQEKSACLVIEFPRANVLRRTRRLYGSRAPQSGVAAPQSQNHLMPITDFS